MAIEINAATTATMNRYTRHSTLRSFFLLTVPGCLNTDFIVSKNKIIDSPIQRPIAIF